MKNMNPDDLDASDTVMFKADALILRHRASAVSDDDLPVLDDALGEDLPVLDEITELAPPPAPVFAPAAPAPALQAELTQSRERIAQLELRLTDLAQELSRQNQAQLSAETRGTQALAATNAAHENAARARMAMAEQLIALDAQMAQALEAWLGNELPQLVASELDGMVERLRVQALAHMRATLAPELSGRISEVLETALEEPPQA